MIYDSHSFTRRYDLDVAGCPNEAEIEDCRTHFVRVRRPYGFLRSRSTRCDAGYGVVRGEIESLRRDLDIVASEYEESAFCGYGVPQILPTVSRRGCYDAPGCFSRTAGRVRYYAG